MTDRSATVEIWDWEHRRPVSFFPTPLAYGRVLFGTDNRLLIVNLWNNHVAFYHAETAQEFRQLAIQGATSSIALSADGTLLATSGFDGIIQLWGVRGD